MSEEYDPAVYDDEDEAPAALQAVKYRALRAELSAILLRFEKASDWADYASQLGEVRRCLTRHAQHAFVPEKYALAKWLAHCLYAGYPAGLHLKALELYELIFRRIGPRRLAKDLNLYVVGLFPLMSYCSTAVRPKLLDIYRRYIVVLRVENLRAQREDSAAQGPSATRQSEFQFIGTETPHANAGVDTETKTHAESKLESSTATRTKPASTIIEASTTATEQSRLLVAPADESSLKSAQERTFQGTTSGVHDASWSFAEVPVSTPAALIETETSSPFTSTATNSIPSQNVDHEAASKHEMFVLSPLATVLTGLVQGLLPALDEAVGTTTDHSSGVEILDLLAQVRHSVDSDALFAAAVWRAMLSVDFNAWTEGEWIPIKMATACPSDRFFAASMTHLNTGRRRGVPARAVAARWINFIPGTATFRALVPFSAVHHAELEQTQRSESSLASRLRLEAMRYLLVLIEEAKAPSPSPGTQPMSMNALFADTGLVTNAFVRALSDRNSLVVRQALDLLLQAIEFTQSELEHGASESTGRHHLECSLRVRETDIFFSTEESKILLGHALLVFLRKDASLHKRLYAWMEDNRSDRLIEAVLEDHLQPIGAISIESALFDKTHRSQVGNDVPESLSTEPPSATTKAIAMDPFWVADTALALAKILLMQVRRERLYERLAFMLISSIWRLGRLTLSSERTLVDAESSSFIQDPSAAAVTESSTETSSQTSTSGRPVVRSRSLSTSLASLLDETLANLIQLVGPDRLWKGMCSQLERLEGRLEPPNSLRVLFECILFLVDTVGLPSANSYPEVFTIIRDCVSWCARFMGSACPSAQLPSLDWRYNCTVLARIVSAVRSNFSKADSVTQIDILMQALTSLDLFESRVWRPWLQQALIVHPDGQRWRQFVHLETLPSFQFDGQPWLVEDARAGCDLIAELVRLALSVYASQREMLSIRQTQCDHDDAKSVDGTGSGLVDAQASSVTSRPDIHPVMKMRLSATLKDAMQLATSGIVPVALLGMDHYLDLMDSALQRDFELTWPLVDVQADGFIMRLIQQCWLFLHPTLSSSGRDTALLWYSLQEFYPSECQHFVADALSGTWGSQVESLKIFRRAFCLARELKLAQSLPSSCLFLVLDQLRSQHAACRLEAEHFVLDAVRLAPELIIGPLLGILLCESYPILNERQEFIARPDTDRILYAFETLRCLFAVLEQYTRKDASVGFRNLANDARLLYRALGAPASSAIVVAITAVSGPDDLVFTQDYMDACFFVALWYLRARSSTQCMRRLKTYCEENGPFRFRMRNLQASFVEVQEAAAQLLEQVLQVTGIYRDCNRLERIAPQVVGVLEPLLESKIVTDESPCSPVALRPLPVLVARILRTLLNLTSTFEAEVVLNKTIQSWSLSPTIPQLHGMVAAEDTQVSDHGTSALPVDQVNMAGTATGEMNSGTRKQRKGRRHGKRLWPKYASWSRMGGFLSSSSHHE